MLAVTLRATPVAMPPVSPSQIAMERVRESVLGHQLQVSGVQGLVELPPSKRISTGEDTLSLLFPFLSHLLLTFPSCFPSLLPLILPTLFLPSLSPLPHSNSPSWGSPYLFPLTTPLPPSPSPPFFSLPLSPPLTTDSLMTQFSTT